KRPKFSLSVIAVLLFLMVGPIGQARADSSNPKLSRALRADAAAGGSKLVDVIVMFRNQTDADGTDVATPNNGTKRHGFKKLPFQLVQVPAGKLDSLSKNAKVTFVSADGDLTGMSLPARQTARLPGTSGLNLIANSSYK